MYKKSINKALMINHSSFRDEKKEKACHFAVGTLFSNFCQGFSNPLGTVSSNMESLRKRQEVLRISEESEKNGGRVQRKAR